MSKVVHFEIPVDDAERAAEFYRGVLGWDIAGFGDQPYWLVTAGATDEPGADGALIARGDIHRTPVLVVGTEDLDGALAAVEANDGRVLQGRMQIPGVGWSAYIEDSEGNTIGLFQPDAPTAPG